MKSSSNLLAYLGIFVLLIFIIVPPMLRVFIPKENEVVSINKKTVMELTCEKIETTSDYKLTRTIKSIYEEGVLQNTIFLYNATFSDLTSTIESIDIDEYDILKEIQNAKTKETQNEYTIEFDYVNNEYSDSQELSLHKKEVSAQIDYYTKENYLCKYETKK